jgi:hypothetical protein
LGLKAALAVGAAAEAFVAVPAGLRAAVVAGRWVAGEVAGFGVVAPLCARTAEVVRARPKTAIFTVGISSLGASS